MYFGQFNPPTDWLIERFFPQGYTGKCVEVGAVDGVLCSNTLYFEQRGWDCLCIEPNTYYHLALAKNRKFAMPFAIADRNVDGVVLNRVVVENEFAACTSLVLDQRLMAENRDRITSMDTIAVNARTLDWCLELTGWDKLDFVTIDTEGTELAALRGFNLHRWLPLLLVIENNFEDVNITEYLKTWGYQKVLRHEVNDFYVRVR